MNQIAGVKSSKLWTNYYILIVVFNLLVSIAHYMVVSTLPIYVKNIGGDNSSAGMLMGAFTIAALLFRPVFGNYLDTKGRKSVLLIGCVLFLAGTVLQSFANSVFILTILRIIQGIGFSANSTAGGTVVADLVPPSRLSEGIGYYGISMTLATAAGPAIALYLIKDNNFKTLFLCISLIIFLALILVILLNYEKKTDSSPIYKNKASRVSKGEQSNFTDRTKRKYGKDTKVIFQSLVIFFTALGYGSILTFLPVYADSKGIENIGMFYTVYAGSILITRLCTGKLADRIGITPVILPAMGLMSAGFVFLAYTETLSILLIAAVLYGFGFGTASPLLNTLILKSYPSEKRGAANAAFFSAMDIGIAAGSILWGVLSNHIGLSNIYIASAGSIMISCAIYMYYYNYVKSDMKHFPGIEDKAA